MRKNHLKNWVLFMGMLSVCGASLEASNIKEKIQDRVEECAEYLKLEIEKIKGGLDEIQHHLNHHKWKGVIPDESISGIATVSHLKMNGHSKAVVVHPGDEIECKVTCNIDPEKAHCLSFYRIIIGFKDLGPQTSVCNYWGSSAGKSEEHFKLIAPTTPGVYQVRYRLSESILESCAFKAWIDDEGFQPLPTATIGVIVVK